jgi:hypothetical protein
VRFDHNRYSAPRSAAFQTVTCSVETLNPCAAARIQLCAMTTKTKRTMTKSPRGVAREALRLARAALPPYSSKYSRQDFTQHQLFALLALKTFFKTDYRGVIAFFDDFAELRTDLGLKKVPHYSTLCYAEQRLLKKGKSFACSPRRHCAPKSAA